MKSRQSGGPVSRGMAEPGEHKNPGQATSRSKLLSAGRELLHPNALGQQRGEVDAKLFAQVLAGIDEVDHLPLAERRIPLVRPLLASAIQKRAWTAQCVVCKIIGKSRRGPRGKPK